MSVAVTNPEDWQIRSFSWTVARQGRRAYPALIPLSASQTLQSSLYAGPRLRQYSRLFPFRILRPRIREEVVQFAEDPKVLVLGHEIDTSAFERLTMTPRDDYARFSGNLLLVGPSGIQTGLLKRVDDLIEKA